MSIASVESDINACKRRIQDYEARLRRLRPVKDSISSLKSKFRTVKGSDKTGITQAYTWKGDTFERFKQMGDTVITEDELFYSAGLDTVLDSVNDEITRLENQILREYGLLGNLCSLLNSLLNEVENALN